MGFFRALKAAGDAMGLLMSSQCHRPRVGQVVIFGKLAGLDMIYCPCLRYMGGKGNRNKVSVGLRVETPSDGSIGAVSDFGWKQEQFPPICERNQRTL